MAAVRMTRVHLAHGNSHHAHIERIEAYDENGKRYDATREEWHTYLKQGGSAYTRDNQGNVAWVYPAQHGTTRWVQTYRDSTPTDNLLWLPTY